jgi:hypothetical protein
VGTAVHLKNNFQDTSKHSCKGKNSCKGKGGCATDGSKMPKH